MLTVVFSTTPITLPVRVSTGGLSAEDQTPAGLAGGGCGLAAEQGRQERAGLPGVLTPRTRTLKIPLRPQQWSSGKRCLHGLQQLVICLIVTDLTIYNW